MQTGKDINLFSIKFNDEKIEALESILLFENNIDIPENLIYYDDSTIDYSDDPKLTKKELKGLKSTFDTIIPVSKEVEDWILKENIDLQRLTSELIQEYFEQNILKK